MILIKINHCTDNIELMKKQIKRLEEKIDLIGNGFGNFKTESKQEIDDYLSIGSDGIIILISNLI